MQQTQILTYGVEGPLGERLREFAQARRIWLRETTQLSACHNLLHASPPNVFVLVLSSDLEKELTLLELVHASLPETASIVIGEADNPALAGLAWELGATYALFPPTPVEVITDILARCLPAEAP